LRAEPCCFALPAATRPAWNRWAPPAETHYAATFCAGCCMAGGKGGGTTSGTVATWPHFLHAPYRCLPGRRRTFFWLPPCLGYRRHLCYSVAPIHPHATTVPPVDSVTLPGPVPRPAYGNLTAISAFARDCCLACLPVRMPTTTPCYHHHSLATSCNISCSHISRPPRSCAFRTYWAWAHSSSAGACWTPAGRGLFGHFGLTFPLLCTFLPDSTSPHSRVCLASRLTCLLFLLGSFSYHRTWRTLALAH